MPNQPTGGYFQLWEFPSNPPSLPKLPEDLARDYETESGGFDWRRPDIERVRQNEIYRELYDRRDERMRIEMHAHEDPSVDIYQLRNKLIEEERNDEENNLHTGKEEREYHHVYVKNRRLEELDHLDPGMYGIITQFQRLPFASHQSCTGHIVEGTDSIEDYQAHPILSFIAYEDVSREEREVQIRFINGLEEVNRRICERLGIEETNILGLHGEDYEDANGVYCQVPLQECFEKGYDMHLTVTIEDRTLALDNGREVLCVIWEEILSHVYSFFPDERFYNPEFYGGNIFVRSESDDD
jgi:hypothetical protein